MKKVLGWIGVGLLGAATAIFGQIMTNHSVKDDVAEYIEENKQELFKDSHDDDDVDDI